MIEYIYFVKCPNCEDESFDFFEEAKEFALGCLSDKPIITQIEVNRNDFGECIDSCDLGTIWSWEDMMKETEAEPTINVFTRGDFAEYNPENDPEFDELDNSVDFEPETPEVSELDRVPDNFRRPVFTESLIEDFLTEDDETRIDPNDERRKSQTQHGYDNQKAPSGSAVSARDNDLENRASRTQLGYDANKTPSKADISARENDLENRDALAPDVKTISKVLVKWASLMDYNTFEKLSGSASKVLKASNPWWLKSPGDEAGYACCVTKDGKVKDESVASKQGFRPMIEIIPADFKDDKLYEPVKAMRGDWIKISDKYLLWKDPTDLVAFDAANTLYNDYDKANIKKVLDAWCEKYFKGIGAVFGSGSAEYTKEVSKELSNDASKRESIGKPIPEGMTIKQLVEAMEENEDTVECVCCQELYPKEDCKHDKKHGWICPDCVNEVVECTWCEDLYDRSQCRKEVDLGWLCSRCEAAIKSRGETLTFREGSYWDLLDESRDPFDHHDPDYTEEEATNALANMNDAAQDRRYDSAVDQKYLDESTAIPDSKAIGKFVKLTHFGGGDATLFDIKQLLRDCKTTKLRPNEINLIAAFDNDCKIIQETELGYLIVIPCYYRDKEDRSKLQERPEYINCWVPKKFCELTDAAELVAATNESYSMLESLETAEEYNERLNLCHECGTNGFDPETEICINCGFNLLA